MSAQDETFALLRQKIITMELLPGTAMSVYEMSEQLQVSRTPVREAFIRLATESLVEIMSQRKTLVSRIDVSRAQQERFMREALEIGVIPSFLRTLTDETLADMRALSRRYAAAIDRGDAVEALALDDAFHRTVFESAGQTLSWQTIETTSGHHRRMRLLLIREQGVAREVVEEHNRMLEAYAARDEADALAWTKVHQARTSLQEAPLREMFPRYFK